MKYRYIRILALVSAMLLCAGACAQEATQAPQQQVDMLAVDHRLYELGYRDSACNGILDEVTITALRNFQSVNGLEPTGEPNPLTVELLLGDTAISKEDYLSMLLQEYAAYGTLAEGSYGANVEKLQHSLKELGYFSGSTDGAYGDETKAAVYRFQLANGLNETGVADSALQLRLYEGESIIWDDFLLESCASVGDSGAEVRRLQLWLKQMGYFKGECTGRYGDKTQQAVKSFQNDHDMETSGDADKETCSRIYSNVSAFLRRSAELHRGDSGTEVDALCSSLAQLGYPAHGRFNMQTELALMQFQTANKLTVNGIADELTLARMRSENAVRAEDYVPSSRLLPEQDGLGLKLARQAAALLGQYSELDSCFGFVQYVALLCDVELMNESQLSSVAIGEADTIEAGAFLGVRTGEEELFGIATSDGAIVYRAKNGYIVMNYLDRMEADSVLLYHIVENT